MSCRPAHGRLEVLQIYRLLQFIHENHKERIAWMVELGVENLINLTEPKDGLGVLHVAVSANDHEMVRFLLSLGAHPNVQDQGGRTPAMLAAQLGNHHIVGVLVENRADLGLQDAGGHGVLFYCMYPTKRHARCLQMALKGDADVNNVSSEGVHVFQRMCEKAEECAPLCFTMLEAGADPNAANRTTGVTALMAAVKAGCLQLVRAILRRGGDPNALSTERLSALHFAAMGGSLEAIQVLSAFSANMGALSTDICTPLHYAAASGDANCCRFLAQRGCNPRVKNKDDVLPRQIAKDCGHKAAAKELRKAEKKSVTNRPTSSPWTLTLYDWSQENRTEIRRACGEGLDTVPTEKFVSVIENLRAPVDRHQLSEVISANDKKREGLINLSDFIKGVNYVDKPFLHSSYVAKTKKKGKGATKGGGKKKKGKKKGKFVLPMPICTRPPELMARRPDGGPPHFMMEMFTNSSDVRRFDRHHPPEHALANDSWWYMEKPRRAYVDMASCVRNGDLQTVDLALSQGVPVDVKDQLYKTPLMVACSSGNVEMVQYLLRKGADVNTWDQFFWTPLHHAAQAGRMEIMKLLLEAGATVDALALNGGTPLMRAIEGSQSSCVDLLIKAGANVTRETTKGQNCLDVATDFADSKIINLVKDKMDSLPKVKEPKRKGLKPKSAKAKGAAAPTDTPHSITAGLTPLKKDPKSIVLQNAHITTGRTNAVDITFVPKTVWGKPPTTSQLMSQMEEQSYSLLTS